MFSIHKPVFLKEVLELLDLHPGDNVIDCTLGGGGHSAAILKKINPKGKLLAIELDDEALRRFKVAISLPRRQAGNFKFLIPNIKNRITLVNDNFKNLKKIYASRFHYRAQCDANSAKRSYPISGILLDLGLSSDQLEALSVDKDYGQQGRGFSFQRDEPLDMRFGQGQQETPNKKPASPRLDARLAAGGQLTADEIINKWPQDELERIFRIYGEEEKAREIAQAIIKYRKAKLIKTTFQLVEIILSVKNSPHARPSSLRHKSELRRTSRAKIHPATKVFQALRIAVNCELENLKAVLPQAMEILNPGGRLVIISFHGLEDKIVKNFFKESEKAGQIEILTRKPIVPSIEEVKNNPRSRSARLRAAVKIPSTKH